MTIPDVRDESAVIRAIEENLFELMDSLGTRCPGATYERREEWIRFLTGVPFPPCNTVLRPRLDRDRIDAQIDEVLAPFRERDLPMLWWTGPSTEPADMGVHLANHGLIKAGEPPCMAMDLSMLSESVVPTGLDIRQALTAEEQADWSAVFTGVFEWPPSAVETFAGPNFALQSEGNQVLRQLIAYSDGLPVACGSFFIAAGVGGVYNIATVDALRGRGIGAAVMAAGFAWLRDAGQHVAILHSTAAGFPFYEKLGFRTYCSLEMYTNAGEAVDAQPGE